MSTKEFTIRNYYTRDIPIDDGGDGDAVAAGTTFPVRIRRFSVAQLQAFQRGFAQLQNPSAARFIFRKPDGDEQAMREVPARTNAKGVVVAAARSEHVVPQEEIERRRLQEMSPETRAAFDAASEADDQFMTDFCTQAITEHVWLPPGVTVKVIQDDDSEFIAKTGADLVIAFGGNLSMLMRLTNAIHHENTLSPEAKKALRLLSGSTASSPTPAAAAAVDGVTPAAIATPAGAEASVLSDGASVGQESSPSGSVALPDQRAPMLTSS